QPGELVGADARAKNLEAATRRVEVVETRIQPGNSQHRDVELELIERSARRDSPETELGLPFVCAEHPGDAVARVEHCRQRVDGDRIGIESLVRPSALQGG